MSPTSSTNLPTLPLPTYLPRSLISSLISPHSRFLLVLLDNPSSLFITPFSYYFPSLSPTSHPSHNSSTPTSLTPVLTFSTIFHLLYDSTSTTHYHHNPPSLSLVACHTIRSSTSTAIVSHAQPRPSSCTTTISWDFFYKSTINLKKVILKLSK